METFTLSNAVLRRDEKSRITTQMISGRSEIDKTTKKIIPLAPIAMNGFSICFFSYIPLVNDYASTVRSSIEHFLGKIFI